jgi:hypothetical protein
MLVDSVESVVIIAVAVLVLVMFLASLLLCAFVVVRTKSTAGLRDVAVVIRAFGELLPRRSTK